jgi:hypothetical protein
MTLVPVPRKWCTVTGEGATPTYNRHLLEDLTQHKTHASVRDISFPDPNDFVAGCVNRERLDFWQDILAYSPQSERTLILDWIQNGVDITRFFKPFTGTYRGKRYVNVPSPPHKVFKNYPVTQGTQFGEWVLQTVLEEERQGARIRVGRVDDPSTPIPHIVSPTGVEPSKPRKVDDCTFLNLWCPAPHFQVEGLASLTYWSAKVAAIIDAKACYFNVWLRPSSRKFFGTRLTIKDVEYFFIATILVFGWSGSPYVNQTLMNAIMRYLRAWTIPVNIFYDDSASAPRLQHSCGSDLCNQECTVSIVVLTLINAGFYISLSKSTFDMHHLFKYLGLMVNLRARSFYVPSDKWSKFHSLRLSIASRPRVLCHTLESFVGKCAFFSFIVQGGLAFTRLQYLAVASSKAEGESYISVSPALLDEISSWEWLLPLGQTYPFLSSAHHQLHLTQDGSDHSWGGLLLPSHFQSQPLHLGSEFSDQWLPSAGISINVREALAVLYSLQTLIPALGIRDAWVDISHMASSMVPYLRAAPPIWLNVGTDNLGIFYALHKGSSHSDIINDILRQIYTLGNRFNLRFTFYHLPGDVNHTPDYISRISTEEGWTLSPDIFLHLCALWGPFTVDAMAAPVNAKCERFISRFLCPGAMSANFLSWIPDNATENIYIFPPPTFLLPAVAHLVTLQQSFVLIAPCNYDSWSSLLPTTLSMISIAKSGQLGPLLRYDTASKSRRPFPCPYELFAYRFSAQS